MTIALLLLGGSILAMAFVLLQEKEETHSPVIDTVKKELNTFCPADLLPKEKMEEFLTQQINLQMYYYLSSNFQKYIGQDMEYIVTGRQEMDDTGGIYYDLKCLFISKDDPEEYYFSDIRQRENGQCFYSENVGSLKNIKGYISNQKESGYGYVADGVLTVKEITKPVYGYFGKKEEYLREIRAFLVHAGEVYCDSSSDTAYVKDFSEDDEYTTILIVPNGDLRKAVEILYTFSDYTDPTNAVMPEFYEDEYNLWNEEIKEYYMYHANALMESAVLIYMNGSWLYR